ERVGRLEVPAVRALGLQRAPLCLVFGRDVAEVFRNERRVPGIVDERPHRHGHARATAGARRCARRREGHRLRLGLGLFGARTVATTMLLVLLLVGPVLVLVLIGFVSTVVLLAESLLHTPKLERLVTAGV